MVIKILSTLINLLICLVGAIITLYFQDWFGSSDTYSLLFWTIPLAIGLAVSGQTILTLFRVQKRLFRFLLIILSAGIISFGFVYLVYMFLGPWINAFSIPIVYLWITGSLGQLLFLDRLLPRAAEKLKPTKIILGIVAFPLTVVVTVIGMYVISLTGSYLTKPEPETFLIPNDFEGKVRIIYGEECGTNPPDENNRRVLKIPDNGLLIIQPEFEAGIIDHEYYFVNKKGIREKASPIYEIKNKSKDVRHGGSGSIEGAMPDGSSSSESPLAIHYTDFYIYNGNVKELTDRDSKYTLQERKIDSLTTDLVNECRERIAKATQQ